MSEPTSEIEESQEGLRRYAYSIFSAKEYYDDAWYLRLKDIAETRLVFNWSACIFGVAWCFYRKMYFAGLILGIIEIAVLTGGLFLVSALTGNGYDSPASRTLISAAIIYGIVRIPFGFFANGIYFQHATDCIANAVQSSDDEAKVREKIVSSGGTFAIAAPIGYGYVLAIKSALSTLMA